MKQISLFDTALVMTNTYSFNSKFQNIFLPIRRSKQRHGKNYQPPILLGKRYRCRQEDIFFYRTRQRLKDCENDKFKNIKIQLRQEVCMHQGSLKKKKKKTFLVASFFCFSFKNFLFSQWPGPYHPLSGRANKKITLFLGGLLIHFKICADCQKSQEKVFFFQFYIFFHIYVAVLCLFFHSIFSSIFFSLYISGVF